MKTWILTGLGTALVAASAAADKLPVAALTSVTADLARQVGGDAVEVMDVMGLGKSPHTFDPRPADLARIRSARVVIASGKGLEDGFMDKVGRYLAPEAILVEAGRTVPSCVVEAGNEVFVCCPQHAAGAIDPHWWHSVKGMQRAVRSVADAFAEADPANKALYKQNAATYGKQLDELHDWVRREVAAIPRSRRYLTTAHAAFGYFCRDYGFKSVPVQGLNKEQDPSPEYLAETIDILRTERIPAVFPEAQANPKVLQSMVAETGARLGKPLLADTLTPEQPTYTDFIRYNVQTIVEALQ